jgi:uncharacterized protein
MKLLPATGIYLDFSGIENAGRGVFAARDFRKDELIERCPVILIEENEVSDIRKTELHNYYFMWGDDPKNHKAAICLGFGSLYNHSYTPNATYRKLMDEEFVEFYAIKEIPKGEEITVNYNFGRPGDKSKLWIESIPGVEE